MSKYKVNKNDINRMLLTEVLPYEVPIIFSNDGFYSFKLEERIVKPPTLISKLFSPNGYRIPFSYKIRKNADSIRVLSIIHPSIQIKFIDFYKKYDSLLIHLCNKSQVSLRFPSKVATHFYFSYNKDTDAGSKHGNIEVERHGFVKDVVFSSSYFAYKKYNFLFKFYDSYEFIRLEKKFNHLLLFDISKCFDNIYTHSISWAVKDKEFAKANIGSDSFEALFDKLMQESNYNETNGILIGSEISRVFAEIILQRIDLNVIEKLKDKNLHLGSDFAIRRYVDDYFVFTNDENLSKEILNEFESQLEFYKLHINKSKTESLNTPFITGITIGRIELQKLLDDFFMKNITYEEIDTLDAEEVQISVKILEHKNSSNEANWLIRDIKSIVKKNQIGYESVSGLTFSMFKKTLFRLFKNCDVEKLDGVEKESLKNFLSVAFDVMFFLYSMDYRVRANYIMTQIIIATNRFLSKCNAEVRQTVKKKMYDELIYLIKNIERGKTSIEFLNLLISLKDLGEDYDLELQSLNSILGIENFIGKSNYFDLMIILYYIEDKSRFLSIKELIELEIITRIERDSKPFIKAELTSLFFDSISCPYVSKLTKIEITKIAFKKIENRIPVDDRINEVVNYISKRKWWIDWNKDIDLDSMLLKKELRSPY